MKTNKNNNSGMKIIFNEQGYTAQVSPDTTCVVHRTGELANGQMLTSHVGEKLPSQDWREVRLMGCPDEIRIKIVQSYKDLIGTR
jgi:hypothetical protein